MDTAKAIGVIINNTNIEDVRRLKGVDTTLSKKMKNSVNLFV